MTIKAILFDIGGVLLLNDLPVAPIQEKWEKRLGLSSGEFAGMLRGIDTAIRALGEEMVARTKVGKLSEDELWQYAVQKYHLSDDELSLLQSDLRSGEKVNQSLLDFIQTLRPHYKLGIISNPWTKDRAVMLQQYPFYALMDVMIFSPEVGIAKPAAKIYLIAAERLGIQPSEAIFIDNSPLNVDGAEAVGMRGIRYMNTSQVISDLSELLTVQQ